jgi:hypothetical protein
LSVVCHGVSFQAFGEPIRPALVEIAQAIRISRSMSRHRVKHHLYIAASFAKGVEKLVGFHNGHTLIAGVGEDQ